MAGDAECGYRFFVDAKHEHYRQVDGQQETCSWTEEGLASLRKVFLLGGKLMLGSKHDPLRERQLQFYLAS